MKEQIIELQCESEELLLVIMVRGTMANAVSSIKELRDITPSTTSKATGCGVTEVERYTKPTTPHQIASGAHIKKVIMG